ncbi:hypothetical protein E2C01_016810 [Portunus trituberculatus]|uniref:Uncharacterized protein n=1 Tax=Portunus trituberculatus TaxID=210409 RepID=A0A5B7DRN3_PORTR|nr:hypothetical protein [Portunus trituberculatus]
MQRREKSLIILFGGQSKVPQKVSKGEECFASSLFDWIWPAERGRKPVPRASINRITPSPPPSPPHRRLTINIWGSTASPSARVNRCLTQDEGGTDPLIDVREGGSVSDLWASNYKAKVKLQVLLAAVKRRHRGNILRCPDGDAIEVDLLLYAGRRQRELLPKSR